VETPEPVEKLTTAELEITTADTRPLPAELRHVVDAATASQAQREASQTTTESQATSQIYEGAGEVLLDLGDFKQGRSVLDEDFVLDVDLDEAPEPSPTEPAYSASASRSRESFRTLPKIQPSAVGVYESPAITPLADSAETTDQLVTHQGYERVFDEAEEAAPQSEVQQTAPAPVPVSSASDLSPEMIDAIAKRAVEQLSEKVIQEIAWEVVPQLAELLIKRQLEEKNS